MDLTGQKLGKYILLEKLGQGGMAQVYKARQPTIERLVAVKVLQTHLSDSAQFVDRFKREAQRLGQLRHPNIVSVLDFDVDQDINFLVMDYISGPSLRSYLEQRVTLTPVEALRIASQITDALQFAHERGVIHCDLNPANVMFQDDTRQQIMLTDFGIARLMDSSGSAQTSTLIGTPTYMSPEAAQGQPLDGRADLYSLGVMLYEMITGKVPYVGNTPITIMMQHVNAPLPDLRKTYPGLPSEYVQIVERALAKKVGDRYHDAAEMRQAIQAAMAILEKRVSPATVKLNTTSQSIQPSTQLSTQLPSQGRTRVIPRWGIAALAVLAVLCVGAFGALAYWGASAFAGNTSTNTPVATVLSASTLTAPAAPAVPAATVVGEKPAPTQVVAVPGATPEGSLISFEANRFGGLKVLLDDKGQPAQFQLRLDHVLLPPAGAGYVLWLSGAGQATKVGEVKVDHGSIFAQFPASQDALASFQQAQITLENDPASVTAPSANVVFAGQYSPALLDIFRQLVVRSNEATSKPYLPAIMEQVDIAEEHQNLILESLAKGDVKAARDHVEHVINTLVGKGDSRYGDLDQNGAVENPGDDVGVIRYINQAIQQVTQAGSADPQTVLRLGEATQAVSIFQQSGGLAQQVIELDQKILTIDNAADAKTVAEQAMAQLQALVNGSNGNGGLKAAYQQVLAAVELPMISSNPQPALAPSGASTDALGVFTLGLDNSFDFYLDGTLTAPSGMQFTLWASQPSTNQFVMMGSLPQGTSTLSGNASIPFLQGLSQIVVSLEPGNNASNRSPSQVVLTGNLSSQVSAYQVQLGSTQGDALLTNANAQLEIAQEHMKFLITALKANDLQTAKAHAEHVINVLNGKGGPNYGDLDGNGAVQDPGDGVGVMGYVNKIGDATQALQAALGATATENQQFYLERMLAAQTTTNQLITNVSEMALKIFAADSASEALKTAQTVQTMLDTISTGQDADNNGAIDPLLGEAGLQGLQILAGNLGTIELHAPQ